VLLSAAVLIAPLCVRCAEHAAWWLSRGILVDRPEARQADYAAVCAGQLKWLATNACDELDANLPGGAGSNVHAVVQGLSGVANYTPVNIGQLKATARPFYDRLIEEGYTNALPWSDGFADDADFALANIGQAKFLFAWDLVRDGDGLGLADWWEILHLGLSGFAGVLDADGDGLSLSDEYRLWLDPVCPDTDGDGVPDGLDPNPLLYVDSDGDGLPDDWETVHFGGLGAAPPGDPDGDGNTNLDEWRAGTDPNAAWVADAGGTLALRVFLPISRAAP
jgi:hypothetical protein